MSAHAMDGPRTKVHEIRGISVDWPDPNIAKFRRAPTKSARDIRCEKFCSREK